MSNQITTYEMLAAWADIVIQRWLSNISKLRVIDTTELMRSFTSQISTDSKGDPQKIVFAFLYYGIFPDMGVGKGVKFDSVVATRRIPKPWYSDRFFKEVRKLGYLLAERYGERAMEAISIIEQKRGVYIDTNDAAWKLSSHNMK